MFLRLAAVFGLFAGLGLAPALVAAPARAQTNIDQGKTPAQIFANDCAACHKAPRGLANGKNSVALAGFLREHYTASREQAAALAAYVLGAGPGPAQPPPGQKPVASERAKVEEPKPASRSARPQAKPEEEAPATAKLQPPAGEETKPEEREARPTQAPAIGRKKPPEAAPAVQEPAPVAAVPMPVETTNPTQSQEASPTTSAAAPAETQSGENAPVPRDNIPD